MNFDRRWSPRSYDDSGKSGHKDCWVIEAGEYNIYVGADVRSAVKCYTFNVDETYIPDLVANHENNRQMLAPHTPFDRLIPKAEADGYAESYEPTPLNENDVDKIIADNLPAEIPQTGDKGIKLADVKSGKNTMDEFVAQLSDNDLTCIIRGEGMGSPKVTPGTTSAFAGVSQSLINYGIPSCCTSDGPSGMRLDCGTKAFSLPNGTLIASTFNTELVYELFSLAGLEISAGADEPGLQSDHISCIDAQGSGIRSTFGVFVQYDTYILSEIRSCFPQLFFCYMDRIRFPADSSGIYLMIPCINTDIFRNAIKRIKTSHRTYIKGAIRIYMSHHQPDIIQMSRYTYGVAVSFHLCYHPALTCYVVRDM
mgnify:CR=1 FL=1